MEPEVDEPAWAACALPECGAATLSEGQDLCFAHVDGKARKQALTGFGRGRLLDLRGLTVNEALWADILAAAPADEGRVRMSNARLDGAIFECEVNLDGAIFRKDASFQGAHFRKDVSLKNVTVAGQARFAKADFDGVAAFDGARFDGPAWFAGASFAQLSSFGTAKFNGPAWFFDANFGSASSFREANFARHVSFERSTFVGAADLATAVFKDTAAFTEAKFSQKPVFDGAAFLGPGATPAIARGAETVWSGPPLAGWFRRVVARLLDLAVPLGLVAAGIASYLGLRSIQEEAIGWVVLVASVVAWTVIVVRDVVAQGRSGQTMGKRMVGIRLVSESDGRPPGVLASVIRQPLHVFDLLPVFVGLLWPLWDAKNQTFTDKVQETVVVLVASDRGPVANRRFPIRTADPTGPPGRRTNRALSGAQPSQQAGSGAKSRGARSSSRQRNV